MNQYEVHRLFNWLDEALGKRRLPTSNGSNRRARANEFMLLCPEADHIVLRFEHRGSGRKIAFSPRSKVIVIEDGGTYDEFKLF